MSEEEKKIKLEIEIAPETATQLNRLFSEHFWERADGLRTILGVGIGTLIAQQIEKKNEDSQTKIISLTRELVQSEGRLSGVQFELAEIKELNRRWELSTGSIHAMNATLEKVILQQNNEISEIKTQLKAALEEINQLGLISANQKIATLSPRQSQKKSWLSRLIGKS